MNVLFFVLSILVLICNGLGEIPSKILTFEEMSKTCQPSDYCYIDEVNREYAHYTAVVDNSRKILMEFSPKAGCTSAVVMFAENMGYKYGVHYTGWPHDFREKMLYRACGNAYWCMYFDPTWYRFKVVRNPYERAVSSYIHCMETVILTKLIPASQHNTTSFLDFMRLVSRLPEKTVYRVALQHISYQVSTLERDLKHHQNISLYRTIVKIEDPTEALATINNATGSNFSLKFKSSHHTRRHNGTQIFVGDKPYDEIRNSIPETYKYFYNSEIKALVEKVYLRDLKMYNYSYPYPNDE
jgi:hypothetical protein